MRRPIVAANWKMHLTIGQAVELASEIKQALTIADEVETVVCPPFTALKPLSDLLRFSDIELGAQNVHWESQGPFTGEVAAPMLLDLGCKYAIVGHSERRTLFGEDDRMINRKLRTALTCGLHGIICVGETLDERKAGQAEDVVRRQITDGLEGIGTGLNQTVIAYEPVWAIGTGLTATPDQVQAAHSFIRKLIREMAGDRVAEGIRIQYGGSVKPENAAAILRQRDVDGGLIGGASLQTDSFIRIVHCAQGS